MGRLSSKGKIKSFSQRRRENMLHCSQIIWKEDSMGEKEGRNTRVLSLFVKLSYGDILKKKEEARHYQVTERTIQRDLETIRSVLEEERKMGRDDRMLLYDREQNGYKICRVYLSREDSHFCKW